MRFFVIDHDILVTNPPYSGEHKVKLLEFLATNVFASSTNTGEIGDSSESLPPSSSSRFTKKLRPFALLLPVYIATKSYWRNFLESSAQVLTPFS